MEQIKKITSKFHVSLRSQIDISRLFQYSSIAQFEELQKPNDFEYYQTISLYEVQLSWLKFIETNNLGGSNWVGGIVVGIDKNFVAKISYNVRIWDNENWRLAKESGI